MCRYAEAGVVSIGSNPERSQGYGIHIPCVQRASRPTGQPRANSTDPERIRCGLEAMGFDDIPFIGPIAGIDELILATGFSGHGFAIVPAVGRSVADQIDGRPTPELDGLSPHRIADFHPGQVEDFMRRI
jgi:glycine/D-amino acid oxidase-like deaminating enzyme